MITIHFILAICQPIPNLIPIISARPETVHLLVSDKMERQATRLERFLNSHEIRCIRHPIDLYDTCYSLLFLGVSLTFPVTECADESAQKHS
jgi:hypothetical protein